MFLSYFRQIIYHVWNFFYTLIIGLFDPDPSKLSKSSNTKENTPSKPRHTSNIERQLDSLLSSGIRAPFSGVGQTLSGKVVNSGINFKNLIIMVGASWCGPCRSIKPFFQELSSRYNATFAYVDVDVVPSISVRLNATSLPTFIIFGGNDSTMKEIDRVIGADKTRLVFALSKMQ